MERSVWRLLLEAAVGAAGGSAFSTVVPEGEGRVLTFALVGALAAPAALLLTPATGSISRRALRYGIALSVLLTLFVSFVVGAENLRLEELLLFGLVILLVGSVGHGVMAVTVDRREGDP